MDEKEYHDYISETHAGHLKALLAKNDIVSYTMVSNSISAIKSTHSCLPCACLYHHKLKANSLLLESNTIPQTPTNLC